MFNTLAKHVPHFVVTVVPTILKTTNIVLCTLFKLPIIKYGLTHTVVKQCMFKGEVGANCTILAKHVSYTLLTLWGQQFKNNKSRIVPSP